MAGSSASSDCGIAINQPEERRDMVEILGFSLPCTHADDNVNEKIISANHFTGHLLSTFTVEQLNMAVQSKPYESTSREMTSGERQRLNISHGLIDGSDGENDEQELCMDVREATAFTLWLQQQVIACGSDGAQPEYVCEVCFSTNRRDGCSCQAETGAVDLPTTISPPTGTTTVNMAQSLPVTDTLSSTLSHPLATETPNTTASNSTGIQYTFASPCSAPVSVSDVGVLAATTMATSTSEVPSTKSGLVDCENSAAKSTLSVANDLPSVVGSSSSELPNSDSLNCRISSVCHNPTVRSTAASNTCELADAITASPIQGTVIQSMVPTTGTASSMSLLTTCAASTSTVQHIATVTKSIPLQTPAPVIYPMSNTAIVTTCTSVPNTSKSVSSRETATITSQTSHQSDVIVTAISVPIATTTLASHTSVPPYVNNTLLTPGTTITPSVPPTTTIPPSFSEIPIAPGLCSTVPVSCHTVPLSVLVTSTPAAAISSSKSTLASKSLLTSQFGYTTAPSITLSPATAIIASTSSTSKHTSIDQEHSNTQTSKTMSGSASVNSTASKYASSSKTIAWSTCAIEVQTRFTKLTAHVMSTCKPGSLIAPVKAMARGAFSARGNNRVPIVDLSKPLVYFVNNTARMAFFNPSNPGSIYLSLLSIGDMNENTREELSKFVEIMPCPEKLKLFINTWYSIIFTDSEIIEIKEFFKVVHPVISLEHVIRVHQERKLLLDVRHSRWHDVSERHIPIQKGNCCVRVNCQVFVKRLTRFLPRAVAVEKLKTLEAKWQSQELEEQKTWCVSRIAVKKRLKPVVALPIYNMAGTRELAIPVELLFNQVKIGIIEKICIDLHITLYIATNDQIKILQKHFKFPFPFTYLITQADVMASIEKIDEELSKNSPSLCK